VLHIGLEAMTERVRLAGGELDVGSEPSAGTRVSFEIPLGQPPADAHPRGGAVATANHRPEPGA
jgi:signal transduction histidine kinase